MYQGLNFQLAVTLAQLGALLGGLAHTKKQFVQRSSPSGEVMIPTTNSRQLSVALSWPQPRAHDVVIAL